MERLKILIFKVRGRQFAFASKNVKEILDFSGSVKPLFYGGRALKGVMNLEGNPVSVLDTAFILDIKEEGEEAIILVCKEKGMERGTGITVSEVKGMEIVDASRITPPQEMDAAYISGFISQGDATKEQVITLLDLKRFLDYADARIDKIAAN